MFNATFSSISAISWRPILVVEEAGVPGENHRPWASNCKSLSLAAASRVHLFLYNLHSRERTHAVLVIGLYELLGNPTIYLIEPPGPFIEKHTCFCECWDTNKQRQCRLILRVKFQNIIYEAKNERNITITHARHEVVEINHIWNVHVFPSFKFSDLWPDNRYNNDACTYLMLILNTKL